MSGPTARNPLRDLALLTLVALLTGIALTWLLSTSPQVAGQASSYTLSPQAYRFSGLEAEFQHLLLVMPEGYMVPVLRAGEISGAVFLGQGQYSLGHNSPADMDRQTGHLGIVDGFTALFSPLGYRQVENLRYTLGAHEFSSRLLSDRVGEVLEEVQAPASLRVFGTPRPVYSQPAQVLVHVLGKEFGHLIYQEAGGREVKASFVSLGEHGVTLPASAQALPPEGWQATARATQAIAVVAFALLVILLFFCLIGMFTVDHRAQGRVLSLGALLPGEMVGLMIALLIAVLAHYLLPASPPPQLSYHILILALLAAAGGAFSAVVVPQQSGKSRLRRLGDLLGLRLSSFPLLLTLGVGTGFLTFLVAHGSIPALSQFHLEEDLGLLAVSALGWALGEEIFFRGYLQTQMQRWLGALEGLAAAALATALISSLPLLSGSELPPDLMAVQLLILTPMGALVYGYLTYRTGSIWASVLARGLHLVLLLLLAP